MPVLFTEFGLSDKKPGFCESKRDAFYGIVYDQVFQSFQRQGGAAGALQWQLLHPAMRDWNDGYGLEPACGSSLCNMISQQSVKLQSQSQSSTTSGNMMFGMEQHQRNKTTGSSGRHSISNLLKKGMNHVFKWSAVCCLLWLFLFQVFGSAVFGPVVCLWLWWLRVIFSYTTEEVPFFAMEITINPIVSEKKKKNVV